MQNSFENICYNIACNTGYNIFSIEEKHNINDTDFIIYLDDKPSGVLTAIRFLWFTDQVQAIKLMEDFFKIKAKEQKGEKLMKNEKEKLKQAFDSFVNFVEDNNEAQNIIDNEIKNIQEEKEYIIQVDFVNKEAIRVKAKSEDEAIEKANMIMNKDIASDYVKDYAIIDISTKKESI